MNICKRFRYKLLLIGVMAMIFLCAIAVFGDFTVKPTVSAQDERDVTLTIDGLSIDNEVKSRIYGNSYEPITATAVETSTGNEISGYGYVIQYNDETLSGGWTTTVPVNAGRYAVRAYGAATANYNEAVSDVAYLVINPRTLEINFIDDYKISNTEGGTRPYNGQPYVIRAVFTNVVKGDNVVPITGGGKAINASDTPYRFTVYGFSASNATIRANYYVQNVTYPYTITRVPMTVVWDDLEHTYDGTQKDPTVAWVSAELMPEGDPEVVAAERINAGNYIVTAEYNGADKDNFEIVNDTQDFTIERARIWISFNGRAIHGHEAILRYIIGYSLSDAIPESDFDYIRANLDTVTLETDWTPTSPMGQPYYIIVAGHNVAVYDDYDLMDNYIVEWHKCFYYPTKSIISTIEWSENDYTYNGALQAVTAVGIDEFGDAIDLIITMNKEFKNAASDYYATATLSTEDAQYYTFSYYTETTKNYTIKRATATVVWSDLEHIYDGTQKVPSVTWESAAVTPEGDPEVVAAERINAGNYTVIAEYNGADKDNFIINGTTETVIINRSDIVVTITLAESSVTFGDDFNANISATWLLDSETSNNDLLIGLISGYSAGDDAGVYTITLDFEKAADASRRSPETFLDNYVITNINDAVLTVHKKEITANDLENWINNGDAIFNGETVEYDGNVHMIYAEINGSASGIIKVGGYLVNGETFNGASEVSDYNVTAVILPVNGNYTAEGLTLSALLSILEKSAADEKPDSVSLNSEGAGGGSVLPSDGGSGGALFENAVRLLLIIVIIATIFGFIAILVMGKKFRDEIAGK